MNITLKYVIGSVYRSLKIAHQKSIWRRMNNHNSTYPVNLFPLEKVKVGRYTYGDLRVYSYRNKDERLEIGNFCSIASDVIFVLSGEHNYKKFTTYPILEKFSHKAVDSQCKGPIIVEDDVWIGIRCTILSGVTIGKGSVVGANSVISKSIPPYSIFVGDKVIRKRFKDSICEKLSCIDFNKLDKILIEKYYNIINNNIDDDNIDNIISCLHKN